MLLLHLASSRVPLMLTLSAQREQDGSETMEICIGDARCSRVTVHRGVSAENVSATAAWLRRHYVSSGCWHEVVYGPEKAA